MRSRKSHHVQESADSDESEKTVENSSASDDDTASSEEEIAKKSKKRRKQSSSSDSDSGDSHHRRSKKKKHKKKKRKHSKKHRRQRSNDDESETNEEVSSDPVEESPPKKKRKHKHKQKHSKKAHTEKYESEEETYVKRQASATEEELILSSDGGRPEHSSHRTATKVVHKSYKPPHSQANHQTNRYAASHSRQREGENEVDRYYRGSSKDRPRRVETFAGGRNAREAPPPESLIDPRYVRSQHQRVEMIDKYAQYGHVQPPKRIEPLMANHRYRETKEEYPVEQYNVNKDYKRGNRNDNYPQRYNNGRERDEVVKYDRFTETNQANRYEGQRYRQDKEDNFKMDRNNRGFDNANRDRDNRYGDNRRDYAHQQNRNVEIKSLMPEKYDSHDNHDNKPGTSGQDSRHYRDNRPVRERMPLPDKREVSHSDTRHHNPRFAHQTSRNDRPIDRIGRNDGSNKKIHKQYDRNEGNSDRNYNHSDRNTEDNRHDARQERKKSDSSYRSRHNERKSRKDDKPEDVKSYDWGKKDESGIKKEKGDREKPNFGLSGKLTEDTNLVNGVVLKYTPPDDARQPKRKWRFYPFKGDKALPILYIHRQPYFLLGRDRRVADIPLDHPSVSKQHAVLQYRMVNFTRDDGSTGRKIRPYIIDLESANGTFVNNKKVEVRKYVELLERDVVKFGFSQREYVLLHENSKDDALDDDVKPNLEEIDVKKES